MADYEYNIFISYRRMNEDWVRWTRDNFVRSLRAVLLPSLHNVSIFFDEQIETGSSWPDHLARALARSQLMIPILCPNYFHSDWCRLELALMHHREKQLGYRTPANPNRLILPMVLNDGNCFPPEVQAMQSKAIHAFANPFMRTDSPRQEEFAECLRKWCPCIEQTLETVPAYDPSWETLAHDQFKETFRIAVAKQKTLPSLSLHPITPPPAP